MDALSFSLSVLSCVQITSAYKPLGSDPRDRCKRAENCPSHYICERDFGNNEYGQCRCDRLYGFYGPHCLKLSITSYVYAPLFCIVILIGALSFAYNVSLMRLLSVHRKLTKRTFVTLCMNIIAPVQSMYFALEYVLTVSEVDKNMKLRGFRLIVSWVGYVVTFFAAMEISTTWIRLTQKVSTADRSKSSQTKLKTVGAICFVLIVIATIFYVDGSFLIAFFIIGSVPGLISLSYWYGGNKVVTTLRLMSIPGQRITPSVRNALELAYAVEDTTKKIICYCIFNVIVAFAYVYTQQGFTPQYAQQNDAPRWTQAQLVYILVSSSSVYSFSLA